MIQEIKDKDFEKTVINSQIPVIVDFWASWCGPCKNITSSLEELYKNFNEKILIFKINVDDNNETVNKYEIRSVPTLIFFKNGKEVKRKIGAIPYNILEKYVNSILL